MNSNYRSLRLLTRFGTAISIAAGVMVPVTTAWAMQSWGWSWPLFAMSLIGGGFAGFFLKVVAELTQVIVEMLLPNP